MKNIKIKILFLVPYPTEGASNRVRVEQFMPYLKSNGIACKVRPFLNKRFFDILYLPHRFIEKAFWFILCTINRILDIIRALGYDAIFIHREAYPLGGAIIESIIYRMGKRIIFDFDDSIFLPNTSKHNIYIERFKKPNKISRIIRMSRLIIAGNDYLKDYALKYNPNVIVIPSCVDTEKYRPATTRNDKESIIVGWIGSNTTKEFIYGIEEVFIELAKRYKNIKIKVIGASFNSTRLNNVVNKRWSLDDEIDDIRSFDIGIMPMPDNEWTMGKCGFKAILCMACGVPVVASPVGMNAEIIENGMNGFLAKSRKDWEDKLSILIENKNLREEMGKKGREKVIDRYSVSYAAPIFYETLIKTFKESKETRDAENK